MHNKLDKRARADLFRERLGQAIETAATNRSALARAAGVSRSTISQLLEAGATRLPNAQLAADCAEALGISTDWLLGLTDRPERVGDILAHSVEMTEAARTVSDEQILSWHREASGYKIRHVPATLPDLLKSREVLSWEYEAFLGKTPDQAIRAMEDSLDWMGGTGSDYEIAMPLHEIDAFAHGTGYWHGLGRDARREQLDRMARHTDDLYPSLRLFLFDARRVFSAPITVFGPLVAVVYVGTAYLAFRQGARVRALSTHFDWLVRAAEVDARHASAHLAALRDHI